MSEHIIHDFYKLTTEERIAVLTKLGLFANDLANVTAPDIFEHLIENYITTYEVGMGVAPNFLIDGKIYHVPLATEEPSVIAGASHAAKIIYENGGFTTQSLERTMIGQLIFKNVSNEEAFHAFLKENDASFRQVALTAHPEIHKLGGGVRRFEAVIKARNFVTLYVYIDTLDAMGANTINTILEALGHFITSHYPSEVLMAIISNLAVGSLITTRVSIDPHTLKNSNIIAHDISLAYEYAALDPFRAATHNKGIMNGISALMLATGNDTRSIEAGAHAYASLDGNYKPLTKWWVEANKLIGEITLPLALGTVGGSMGVLPKVKLAHKILNIHDAKALMKVAAAVGLAQNFAALYALTTEGINKGHMRLHARNVALLAGATKENLQAVIEHMLKTKSVTATTARAFLNKIVPKK